MSKDEVNAIADRGEGKKQPLNIRYAIEDIMARLKPSRRLQQVERDIITEFNTTHLPSPKVITVTKKPNSFQYTVSEHAPGPTQLGRQGQQKGISDTSGGDGMDKSNTMFDLFVNRPSHKFKHDLSRRGLSTTLRESVTASGLRLLYTKKGGSHRDEKFKELEGTQTMDISQFGLTPPQKESLPGSVEKRPKPKLAITIHTNRHSIRQSPRQTPLVKDDELPPLRIVDRRESEACRSHRGSFHSRRESAIMRQQLGDFIAQCDSDQCPRLLVWSAKGRGTQGLQKEGSFRKDDFVPASPKREALRQERLREIINDPGSPRHMVHVASSPRNCMSPKGFPRSPKHCSFRFGEVGSTFLTEPMVLSPCSVTRSMSDSSGDSVNLSGSGLHRRPNRLQSSRLKDVDAIGQLTSMHDKVINNIIESATISEEDVLKKMFTINVEAEKKDHIEKEQDQSLTYIPQSRPMTVLRDTSRNTLDNYIMVRVLADEEALKFTQRSTTEMDRYRVRRVELFEKKYKLLKVKPGLGAVDSMAYTSKSIIRSHEQAFMNRRTKQQISWLDKFLGDVGSTHPYLRNPKAVEVLDALRKLVYESEEILTVNHLVRFLDQFQKVYFLQNEVVSILQAIVPLFRVSESTLHQLIYDKVQILLPGNAVVELEKSLTRKHRALGFGKLPGKAFT